ncbi:MAG: AAA family ATPase [Woeseiaceae bacterium]
MDQRHDLEIILKSRTPIVVIETRDESRILDLLKTITIGGTAYDYMPLFRWTVTDGLQRLDIALEPQPLNSEPGDVLKHIRAVSKPGIYVLLDFHPFLEDPVHVRLLKDICIRYREVARQIVLISHTVKLPGELESFSARFDMALPSEDERRKIVKRVADEWTEENPGARVQADSKAYELLIRNLAGLTYRDTEQLARNAIYVDGAITKSDLPNVMKAKYELLNRGGALQFEYDTAKFSDVGGVPLLRLDFGAIYDKYHGETERKLRESLKTADVMSPCVLWIDEVEKGIAGRGGETGTTQRVLGTFLTWMAEKKSQVFVVATANDISTLPPELVRKGRFDEIFFVDLPDKHIRASILAIHLTRRDQSLSRFRIEELAEAMKGFSGAEIEQAVVSALYAAHAQKEELRTRHILHEVEQTRPLSVVMDKKIHALREWADGRTVPCD